MWQNGAIGRTLAKFDFLTVPSNGLTSSLKFNFLFVSTVVSVPCLGLLASQRTKAIARKYTYIANIVDSTV